MTAMTGGIDPAELVSGMLIDTMKDLCEEFNCERKDISIVVTVLQGETKVRYWAFRVIEGIVTLEREI